MSYEVKVHKVVFNKYISGEGTPLWVMFGSNCTEKQTEVVFLELPQVLKARGPIYKGLSAWKCCGNREEMCVFHSQRRDLYKKIHAEKSAQF